LCRTPAELASALVATLSERAVSREAYQSLGVGPQDIFYSQVSKIDEILVPLQLAEKQQLELLAVKAASDVQSRFRVVSDANEAFEALYVQPIISFRATQFTAYFADIAPQLLASTVQMWTWAPLIQRLVEDQIQITKALIGELLQHAPPNSAYSSSNASAAKSQQTSANSYGLTSVSTPELDLLFNQMYHLSNALLHDFDHRMRLLQLDPYVSPLVPPTFRTFLTFPFE